MPPEEVLGALSELRDAGKVRVIGCSNETSWGVMKSLWRADLCGTDRYETVLDQETLDRIDQIDFEIPTTMTEDGLRRL